MNTLNYITNESFSSIPSDLVSDLQRMLSTNESFRPTAIDFTGKCAPTVDEVFVFLVTVLFSLLLLTSLP